MTGRTWAFHEAGRYFLEATVTPRGVEIEGHAVLRPADIRALADWLDQVEADRDRDQ